MTSWSAQTANRPIPSARVPKITGRPPVRAASAHAYVAPIVTDPTVPSQSGPVGTIAQTSTAVPATTSTAQVANGSGDAATPAIRRWSPLRTGAAAARVA